jgi:hypothetical protein
MRIPVALLLLLAGLAGCTGDGGDAAPQPTATPTTGILRGVVVDEAIRPLAGVAVRLAVPGGGERNATTPEDGAFAFDGLAPGAYVLRAAKRGYFEVNVDANVTAGLESVLRLVLPTDILNTPSIEGFSFNGFLQCSLTAFLVRVAACSPQELAQPVCGVAPCDALNVTNDQFMAVHPFSKPSIQFLQSELVWDAGSSLSTSLRAVAGAREPGTGELTDYRAFEGPSPLAMPIAGEAAQALLIGNGRDLAVRVFSGYAEGTAPPACLPSPVGCPWGVGAAFEQSFQLFTHAFFGFAPPDGWQFSRDGLPPVPA